MFLVPILIFWALAIWGLFSKRPLLLYLFFGSMPFGSFAALPTAMTAGLTFTPTPLVALLIALRSLGSLRGLDFTIDTAMTPRKAMLLFLFWVTAIFTTIFMPRVFIGAVNIIPVRGLLNSSYPLYPTTQNVSQMAYLTISIVTVVAFMRLLQNDELRRHALRGLCLGAAVTVFTGFLDFATQYAPITPLLEPFRTATYALLTDVEVLGAKRVIGLMPEASSFGLLCLTFLSVLVFMRPLLGREVMDGRLLALLLALLTLFSWLSTSSSTYVGLILLGALLVAEWTWRAYISHALPLRARGLRLEFWLAFGGAFAILAVILILPSLLDPITAMFDRMVLQKTSSQSFDERNMWTTVSLQALVDTYGIGVGMGSTRPSNALIAVVSSTGVLGALLYYGFVLQSLLRRAPDGNVQGELIISAVRWSFLPIFSVGLLVGTTADFGMFSAFQYGLLAAVSLRAPLVCTPPGALRRSRGRIAGRGIAR